MATIEICDICHTSKDVKRVYLCYDRTSNGAPSSEDTGETFDLCATHRAEVCEATLVYLMDKYKIHKHEKNKLSIDIIKRRMKKLEGK